MRVCFWRIRFSITKISLPSKDTLVSYRTKEYNTFSSKETKYTAYLFFNIGKPDTGYQWSVLNSFIITLLGMICTKSTFCPSIHCWPLKYAWPFQVASKKEQKAKIARGFWPWQSIWFSANLNAWFHYGVACW